MQKSWCRGDEIGTVELNKSGFTYFEKLQDLIAKRSWFELFVDGVSCYACRDTGEGICSGREHFATAIEYNDADILQSVFQPLSIEHCFRDMENFDAFSDEARLATEEYWSSNFQGRRSAKIF